MNGRDLFDLFLALWPIVALFSWAVMERLIEDPDYLAALGRALGMEVHPLSWNEDLLMRRWRGCCGFSLRNRPNFKVRNLNTGNFHYVKVLELGFIYQDVEYPTIESLKARLEPEVLLVRPTKPRRRAFTPNE